MGSKSTKVKTPESEGPLLRIAAQQRSMADSVNSKANPFMASIAKKDDTSTLRAGANAGHARSMADALSGASNPTERANLIISGSSAKMEALGGANTTGSSARLSKMGDFIGTQIGTAQAATQSLGNLNQMNSQNAINSMQLKMQRQQAIMGAVGSVVGGVASGYQDYKAGQLADKRHSQLLAALGGTKP